MGHTPKGRCPVCGAKKTLEWKGSGWVFPSHNIRIIGKINPECNGTGKTVNV